MDHTTIRNPSGGGTPLIPVGHGLIPNRYPFLLPSVEDGDLGRIGNYRVRRLLGEGGMGMVFEAVDIDLGRAVALKVVRPELDRPNNSVSRERFLREARAMATLKNEHLVTVYHVGREAETAFLAMELLSGEPLEDRLRRPGRMAPAEVLRVAREVAVGLSAIHLHGLIHRDIKPSNLWLEGPSQRVKILDFGLARDSTDTHLTHSGVVVGTPAYLSPEQARGLPATSASDLFSFGCVLYRMCTGSVPFPATTVTAQLLAIVSDEPIPVRSANPAIPEPLAALTGRLLAKNAADRPPSAVAVADELQRIELQLSGSTVPSSSIPVLIHSDSLSSVPHASRLARRSTTLALLAVVVVLVATLIALLAIRLPGAKPPVDQPTPANVPKPPSDRPAEAPSLTPVAPVAEVTREPVFLTDIKPSTTVNWPHREGEKSPRPLPAVVVDRKPSPHGLFMYACHPDTHPISVSYALDGKYRRFDTDVAVNDSAHASSGVWSPLTFVVTGDGKVLWESSPTMSVGKPQACSLDVTDVRVLTLQVTTPVVLGGNHGAWVEPRLTR